MREFEQYHRHDAFPSAFFLAPNVFKAAQLELPRPKIPIPQLVVDELGNIDNLRDIAKSYFRRMHPGWPIISKRRFYLYLLNPLSQRRQELHLLAIAMKLATMNTQEFDYKLYNTAKRFLFDLETAGLISIHVLHAAIFLSICEIGHAIYPAAYLSVGACARYGTAMGIDKDTTTSPSESHFSSLDELEERRRTWWSILILDRQVPYTETRESKLTHFKIHPYERSVSTDRNRRP